MRISESWLREWISTDLDRDGIAEALTLAGLEVDAVEAAAADFSGVEVGRILDVTPHPNADKLRLCQVDAGESAPLSIVCGAPNAAAGLTVPLARVGAQLPGGLKIREAKVRGEPSAGMLCAAAELGITDQADGLWELPVDLTPGQDLRAALQLNDAVIEIDLTPNRGDCLSMRGVARDLAACTSDRYTEAEIPAVPAASDATHPVSIENTDACLRYAGRVIRGINPQAATPLWMVERLRRADIGSISLPVDITNYVMLELGQPMHAFDLARLDGAIEVRQARQDESLTLLDGQEVKVDASTLVIADQSGPVALAGVMGGARTAVEETTTDVFLESACFLPSAVAGQGRRYKIHTDSLHRFERGVDATIQELAIERATALLIEHGGGEAGVTTVTGQHHMPANLTLRTSAVKRLLGADIPAAEITRILTALGLQPVAGQGDWQITVPGWRYDLQLEADLVEEVARVYGYHRLPAADTPVELPGVGVPAPRCDRSRAREVLVQRGYHEVVGYTFVDSALQEQLGTGAGIRLDNPIAEQFAEMRTSLWPSMLPLLQHNLNRQQERVRLFEIGRRFLPADKNCANEQEMIAGLVCGNAAPEQWDLEQKQVDIYDVRADLEALFHAAGKSASLGFEQSEHPALHPGQTARVLLDGVPCGWLGVINPSISKALDIKKISILFEVDWSILSQQSEVACTAVSNMPEVRRDLALVVPKALAAGELLACIRHAKEALLTDVQIFDLYTGPGVEGDCKSVALSLIFQEKTRTLIDNDVEQAVARLLQILEKELGATIRN